MSLWFNTKTDTLHWLIHTSLGDRFNTERYAVTAVEDDLHKLYSLDTKEENLVQKNWATSSSNF